MGGFRRANEYGEKRQSFAGQEAKRGFRKRYLFEISPPLLSLYTVRAVLHLEHISPFKVGNILE